MGSFGTVLSVDNDEFTLIELESVLESAGFNPTTTWDVSEAARLLNTNTYDYILMGECLSGENARRLLQCEKARAARPCVILSPRSVGPGAHLPTVGPIRVCKRRADDVLRALSGERTRALAHAA